MDTIRSEKKAEIEKILAAKQRKKVREELKMKRVDVYKDTQDDWYPAYNLNGGKSLVRVSFIQMVDSCWRVCAWGADDCGLEKDFDSDQESHAWVLFLEVIGMEFVNMEPLIQLGFYSA